jgi:hypothetical protein
MLSMTVHTPKVLRKNCSVLLLVSFWANTVDPVSASAWACVPGVDCVHGGHNAGHGTHEVRDHGGSHEHAKDGHDLLPTALGHDVPIAHGGESGHAPVEGGDVPGQAPM